MKGLKESSKEQEMKKEQEESKKSSKSETKKDNVEKTKKKKEEKSEKKEVNPEKAVKEKKEKKTKKEEKANNNVEESKTKAEKKEEKKDKEENKDENNKKGKEKFKKVEEKPKKIQNAVEKMMEYRKKRILIPIFIVLIVAVIGVFCSTIFALVNINNKKIISGVSISGIDVSGLSQEEASSKINSIYQEKLQKEIGIKYQDYTNTLNPTLLEVNYDIDKAVEEAYLIGKKDNIFVNNYEILFSLLTKRNINVDMTLNEEVAKQTIVDIGVNLPGIIIESSHAIEDDELIITKGKSGIIIDADELLNLVKQELNNVESNKDDLEIPVKQKNPEPIDIDKIHEEVYTEAKDAYFVKEPFAVYPEVEGIDFDVEVAREILKEDKEEYVIPLIITKPKVTLSQIGTEAFPNQISTFTTRYDTSDVGRSTNLSIACRKLNGKVVLPGETLSYNQTLGPRTIAAGYRTGHMYSGGQVVDSIGGGICQISSTLYNAVLMANLEIVERSNHQFLTGYVPAGRDATVAYGVVDFKFKNTRQYPIRLVASAANGIATVSIYGLKEENEYTISFSTKTIATIPFAVQYEEDANLPTGTENVKQKGTNGLKTETYIIKSLNGKVVSTYLLSRDTYDAMPRIVVRGTGAATNNTPTTPEAPVNPTPEQNNNNKPTDSTNPPKTDTENTDKNTNTTSDVSSGMQ